MRLADLALRSLALRCLAAPCARLPRPCARLPCLCAHAHAAMWQSSSGQFQSFGDFVARHPMHPRAMIYDPYARRAMWDGVRVCSMPESPS